MAFIRREHRSAILVRFVKHIFLLVEATFFIRSNGYEIASKHQHSRSSQRRRAEAIASIIGRSSSIHKTTTSVDTVRKTLVFEKCRLEGCGFYSEMKNQVFSMEVFGNGRCEQVSFEQNSGKKPLGSL